MARTELLKARNVALADVEAMAANVVTEEASSSQYRHASAMALRALVERAQLWNTLVHLNDTTVIVPEGMLR